MTGEAGKQIAKEIKRFARVYPQVQVVVTCRTQSQESRFERFDYVEVADFNEEQVRAFTAHWFGTVCADAGKGETKAREFLEQLFLDANKPIRELAITPILLSLTCAVFHQTGKFYSKRSKLYEEGLELLLEQWDKSRSIERDEIYRDLSVERKLELLSYLAVKKFEQPQYVLFEQAEVEGYIAEFLGIGQRDSRVVLRAIEEQHGLLIERSRSIYSFSHLSIQEYLTTIHFDRERNWDSLIKNIPKKNWEEVFIIMVSIQSNPEIFLDRMKKYIDNLVSLDKNAQYLLASISQVTKSSSSVYSPIFLRAFCLDIVLDLNLEDMIDLFFGLNPDEDFSRNSEEVNGQFLAYGKVLTIRVYRTRPILYYYICIISLYLIIPLSALLGNKEKGLRAKAWIKILQLSKLALSYRKMSKEYHLSDEQLDIYKKYFYANKLIVNCILSDLDLQKFKARYFDELFLPTAEIEKRKREKLEL